MILKVGILYDIKWIRTLEEAKRAIEEREDDVKLMNSIMSYSKCVTQRDAQKNDRVYIFILTNSFIFCIFF